MIETAAGTRAGTAMPTGMEFVLEGRPCRVAHQVRAYSNGRRGAGCTKYVVYFLDGTDDSVPFTFNAGEFNRKAFCARCGKRSSRCQADVFTPCTPVGRARLMAVKVACLVDGSVVKSGGSGTTLDQRREVWEAGR